MTWLKVDDGFTRNPKVFALSHQAFRLHVAGLCHCAANLTDGWIQPDALPFLAAEAKVPKKYVAELVTEKLWKGIGPWEIHDYLEYNPSKAEVEENRRRNAERQREWRERNAVSNALVTASVTLPQPSPAQPETEVPAEEDDYGLKRLMMALTDADDGTLRVVLSIVRRYRLTDADLEWARECALGPGVDSPVKVAVRELQKRGMAKAS